MDKVSSVITPNQAEQMIQRLTDAGYLPKRKSRTRMPVSSRATFGDIARIVRPLGKSGLEREKHLYWLGRTLYYQGGTVNNGYVWAEITAGAFPAVAVDSIDGKPDAFYMKDLPRSGLLSTYTPVDGTYAANCQDRSYVQYSFFGYDGDLPADGNYHSASVMWYELDRDAGFDALQRSALAAVTDANRPRLDWVGVSDGVCYAADGYAATAIQANQTLPDTTVWSAAVKSLVAAEKTFGKFNSIQLGCADAEGISLSVIRGINDYCTMTVYTEVPVQTDQISEMVGKLVSGPLLDRDADYVFPAKNLLEAMVAAERIENRGVVTLSFGQGVYIYGKGGGICVSMHNPGKVAAYSVNYKSLKSALSSLRESSIIKVFLHGGIPSRPHMVFDNGLGDKSVAIMEYLGADWRKDADD